MSSRKTTLEQHPRNTREIASGTVAFPIASGGAHAWSSKVINNRSRLRAENAFILLIRSKVGRAWALLLIVLYTVIKLEGETVILKDI